MIYLMCHVTSGDKLTEGSNQFLIASSGLYVITLIGLVTIGIVMVEMFSIPHVTSRDHMFKGLYEFYRVI